MTHINYLFAQFDYVRHSVQPESAWQIDDRDWFAAHSSRGYRLRETFEGESPTLNPYTLVRRLDTHIRGKQELYCAGVPTSDLGLLLGPSALADTALAMLWEAVRTGKKLPLSDIVAQARVLHSAVRH